MSLRIGTPVITVAQLKDGGVCGRWRAKLYRMFGPEIPVTLVSCVEHAEDIDWNAAACLLHGAHGAHYWEQHAHAWREHCNVSVVALEKLSNEMSAVSGRLNRVRTEVYNLTSRLSDRKRANSILELAYALAQRAAKTEFLTSAAESIMRYDIRMATSFCVAYTQQWTKAGAA